jgi:hypothetical protein
MNEEHQNHDALMAVTKPDAGLFLLRVEKTSNGIFLRGESLSIGVDQFLELGAVSAVVVLQKVHGSCCSFAGPAYRLAMKRKLFGKSTHLMTFTC